MTARKILLVVTSIASAQPFIGSIARQLRSQGHAVDILDLSSLDLHMKEQVSPIAPRWAARLTGIRKLGVLAQILSVAAFSRQSAGSYDAVTIHSCDHVYAYLTGALRKLGGNFSAMIWGSDFYRASTAMRERHRRVYDRLDYIVFANPGNARDFNDYYRDAAYRRKSVLAGFGVDMLEMIRDLAKNRSAARERFGFPAGKLSVACGYNGRPIQQHSFLLDAIGAQSTPVRDRLHLVLQWGYGGDPDYRRAVEQQAERLGLQLHFLDDRLDDHALAALRVATDITLTAQLSDGFSHSIQEALVAGSVVLAGDWLPYDYPAAHGVYLCRASPAGFATALADIVGNYSDHRQRAADNWRPMEALSSWASQRRRWDRLYAGDPELVFAGEASSSYKAAK